MAKPREEKSEIRRAADRVAEITKQLRLIDDHRYCQKAQETEAEFDQARNNVEKELWRQFRGFTDHIPFLEATSLEDCLIMAACVFNLFGYIGECMNDASEEEHEHYRDLTKRALFKLMHGLTNYTDIPHVSLLGLDYWVPDYMDKEPAAFCFCENLKNFNKQQKAAAKTTTPANGVADHV